MRREHLLYRDRSIGVPQIRVGAPCAHRRRADRQHEPRHLDRPRGERGASAEREEQRQFAPRHPHL